MAQQRRDTGDPPIEVAVAFHFIKMCNELQGPRHIENPMEGLGLVEGGKLEYAQELAFVAANTLIRKYFEDAKEVKPWKIKDEEPAVRKPQMVPTVKNDGPEPDRKTPKKIVRRTNEAGGPDGGTSPPGEGENCPGVDAPKSDDPSL